MKNNPKWSYGPLLVTARGPPYTIHLWLVPASKWPFDHPNGGHQEPLFKGDLSKTPPKKIQKRSLVEEPGKDFW